MSTRSIITTHVTVINTNFWNLAGFLSLSVWRALSFCEHTMSAPAPVDSMAGGFVRLLLLLRRRRWASRHARKLLLRRRLLSRSIINHL